jgi:Tat protein secretion system quality control protein TatD with DNase activity
MIAYTAERIAQVRGTTAQALCDLTRRNTCTLFGLNEKDFI